MVSLVLRITSFISGAVLAAIGLYVMFVYGLDPFDAFLEIFGTFLFLGGLALILASYLYSEENTEKGDVHTSPPLGRRTRCVAIRLGSQHSGIMGSFDSYSSAGPLIQPLRPTPFFLSFGLVVSASE